MVLYTSVYDRSEKGNLSLDIDISIFDELVKQTEKETIIEFSSAQDTIVSEFLRSERRQRLKLPLVIDEFSTMIYLEADSLRMNYFYTVEWPYPFTIDGRDLMALQKEHFLGLNCSDPEFVLMLENGATLAFFSNYNNGAHVDSYMVVNGDCG